MGRTLTFTGPERTLVEGFRRLDRVGGLEELVESASGLLRSISRSFVAHPLLGPALALKGGTALNLLAEVPPRLSVDLDFNFVGSVGREEMLAARPDVERSATTVARALGYQVQMSRSHDAGRRVFLGYIDLFGAPNRIELDLNFLHRQPLEPPVDLPLWQPAEAARPIARAMSLSEIGEEASSSPTQEATVGPHYAGLIVAGLGMALGVPAQPKLRR